jgi:hypothetical protein
MRMTIHAGSAPSSDHRPSRVSPAASASSSARGGREQRDHSGEEQADERPRAEHVENERDVDLGRADRGKRRAHAPGLEIMR